MLFDLAVLPRHPTDLTLQQDGVPPIRCGGDVREDGAILHCRDAGKGCAVAPADVHRAAGAYYDHLDLMIQEFVGMIIDPYVVMNVSFHRYKPLSYYYLKNLDFLVVLICCGVVGFLCSKFILPESFFSLTVF